jgi:hypothetical protein
MTTKTQSKAEKARQDHDNAVNLLRSMLPKGSTVYVVVRNIARSGMSRTLSTIVVEDGVPRDMSWSVARALGWTYDTKYYGVKVAGCGMDMGFHLTYELAQVLYPDEKDALYHSWL